MARGVQPNLSLILGGAGTTLEELVGGYRALARGGLAGQPRLLSSLERRESRLMSEGAAYIVRDILEGGGNPERAFTEGTRKLAWKTGTSFGFRDAWAVGVTNQYAIGVWVGRPDGTPNPGYFGANTAAPLLQDMLALLPEKLSTLAMRPRPKTVSAAYTCWPSGLRAESVDPLHCELKRPGWVLQETAPPTLPDRYRSMSSNQCGTAWPVALAPWAPQTDSLCTSNPTSKLHIQGIDQGARLKAVPGSKQLALELRARGAGQAKLYWLLDGRIVGQSQGESALTLRLDQAGPHRLTVMDDAGRFHAIEFVLDFALVHLPPTTLVSSSA